MMKVAHVMRSYLSQSETFIWQYLHMFESTYPVVIAEYFQNLDQFALPKGKLYSTSGARFSKSWFIDNWSRRVLKRLPKYMEQTMRDEGIKVLHAHFGQLGCLSVPFALALDIPIITNFYGQDLSNKVIIEQHKKAYGNLFMQGNLFLVEGPSMREKLFSLGCPEEKIAIQRIAVDLENYRVKTHSWDKKRPICLLFVGRFIEKKGLEYALRALAKIKNDYSFQFRIIGTGKIEKNLRSLASELGLADKIKWLGMQPHPRVIEELQLCDILIQPSVTAKSGDSEGGAPTIILEAQACGVPVISTTHADIPYATRQNDSALLAPEKDVVNLADNLRYLFENPQIWSEMGKQGRQHVEHFHNVRKEIKALENLYYRLVS